MNSIKHQLIDLLLKWPGIDETKNRPFLIQDLVAPDLYKKIDWQGGTDTFVRALVALLAKNRKDLLGFLDELAKSDRMGIDRRQEVRERHREIATLSPQQWFQVFGASDWREWDSLPDCPYRGLQVFQTQDKDLFFGRQKSIVRLLGEVKAKQLVAVIGSSGSGKSSLVFAGLIPQLPNPESWNVVSFRPGKNPFDSLAAALLGKLGGKFGSSANLPAAQIQELARQLQQDKDALQKYIAPKQRTEQKTLLLVADQFEELYTLCSDLEMRSRFLDRLLTAVHNAPAFKLVLTMRADFYHYALRYRPFVDALQNACFNLGPMNREELEEAIALPAESRGVSLEKGLVERILEDIDKRPDEEEDNSNGKQPPDKLPLLEFALKQLWEEAAKDKYPELTNEAYSRIGGVEQALANYAEKIYADLLGGERQGQGYEQKQIQQVFIQLVRPGEETGTEDTRRLAMRSQIGEENWDLVARLNREDLRLLVIGRDDITDTETVEVVHEVLISGWSRLTGWMNANRAFRTWQERLRGALRQWQSSKKDRGALLRGVPLAEAEGWLLEREEDIKSLEEREFIRESVRWRDREKLILKFSLFVAILVAIFSSSIVAYPWYLRWRAINLGKMALIPGGIVNVGTNSPDAPQHERPQTTFNIDSFWLDRFEVSNRQYRFCVEAGPCGEPIDRTKFEDQKFLDHPVVEITAYQAAAYCRWVGKRLPTELEWAQAARSGENLPWPWGNQPISAKYANVLDSQEDTQPVDSYKEGQSKQGVYNLVGNVWEWTASYWQKNYQNYNSKLVWNHPKKQEKSQLVARGGGWQDEDLRITLRTPAQLKVSVPVIGFRCAKNVNR